MRRYKRASTILTSNRPVDDLGKLLGDTAAVTALLDRLLQPQTPRLHTILADLQTIMTSNRTGMAYAT